MGNKEVQSIVITGYGTNCEMEMAHACHLAGSEVVDIVPEAYHHRTNHPRWTREELPEEGMGLAFFINAVQYIRNHLLL